ncbi:MAG: class I SAM-dependent methyltransferase [Acidobacteriota bacterium]
MGITRGSARLLLEESKRRPFEGSALELGKMFVFFDQDDLAGWARRHETSLATGVEVRPSHEPMLASHGCMDDTSFFRLLGFDRVTSVDATDWEGADVVADLNQPLPEALHGQYDLVFEGGTLQSIFDTRQAMRNIHSALRPGGRVVHAMTPVNNQVDLGFYMFSPTFFVDYYEANGWTLETVLLCEHMMYWVAGRVETGPWDVYRYEPGCLDNLSYGRYGGKQASLFMVATKHEATTADVIPQQSYYRRLWDEDSAERRRALEARAEQIAAKRWWYGSHLYDRYKRFTEVLRRGWLPRPMPPKVARL